MMKHTMCVLFLLYCVRFIRGSYIRSLPYRIVLASGWMLACMPVSAGQRPAADSSGLTIEIGDGVAIEMLRVPSGEFEMGSPLGDSLRDKDETPHRVRISRPFFLGKYELTQNQWRALGLSNLSWTVGENLPVTQCNWIDVTNYIALLNDRHGHQLPEGYAYRLPSEAEWEYACRAGTTTRYFYGDDAANWTDYAWHDENSGGTMQPVGLKKPNQWGFHDMLGNVYEWCWDFSDELQITGEITTDPVGPGPDAGRVAHVIRGGSYADAAAKCRTANRVGNGYINKRRNHMGFRLAAGLPLPAYEQIAPTNTATNPAPTPETKEPAAEKPEPSPGDPWESFLKTAE